MILNCLGQTDAGDPLILDLDRLIGSHACVIANSGGGKSGLIRRLLEITHGHVQHIILDVEDEFYTLREHYDYVIAGGEGGDAPATVDGAAALARATLTHGFSLIVQLNDLGPDGAPDFVGRFLDSLITAPRELWRPVLVVLDEAQRFAPQDGITSATHGVRALTAQGRKRGFTAVIASQRIAKIDADVRGDINNWMLGRVGQSLDRKTMADALGFSPSSAEARGLQGLPDRTFWGFGPALSRTPTLFRVADVETTPVKPGQAKVPTPPPPEALREILQGLAVVAQPVAEAQSNAPVELSTEHRTQLSTAQSALAAMEQRALEAERLLSGMIMASRQTEEAVGDVMDMWKLFDAYRFGADQHLSGNGWIAPDAPDAPPVERTDDASLISAPSFEGQEIKGPSPAATAIVDLLDRVNPARLTWTQAATLTGRKASGGNFNAARKWLRDSGRIIEDGDFIRSAAEAPAGMSRAEAIELWKSVLTNPAPRMIDAFINGPLTKDELGQAIGAQPRGGNFNNGLSQLRRNGLIVNHGMDFLKLADRLPGECE